MREVLPPPPWWGRVGERGGWLAPLLRSATAGVAQSASSQPTDSRMAQLISPTRE